MNASLLFGNKIEKLFRRIHKKLFHAKPEKKNSDVGHFRLKLTPSPLV